MFLNQTYHSEQGDGDGFISDATANLNMSQANKPIKPFKKYQNMEWQMVHGKLETVNMIVQTENNTHCMLFFLI